MIFIGILIGTALGMFFMGLMAASSHKSKCEECRQQRAKAAMDYVSKHTKGPDDNV